MDKQNCRGCNTPGLCVYCSVNQQIRTEAATRNLKVTATVRKTRSVGWSAYTEVQP